MMLMFFCIPLLRHRFLKWKSILQKPTYFPSYCRGEPVCSPLHRRCFHVRLSIGTQTFCSTPKDSRKGCPYTPKETSISIFIVGESLEGSLGTDVFSTSDCWQKTKRLVQRSVEPTGNPRFFLWFIYGFCSRVQTQFFGKRFDRGKPCPYTVKEIFCLPTKWINWFPWLLKQTPWLTAAKGL